MHMPPLFCIKTNLRENFLRQGWRLVDENGTYNVKIPTKI